MSEISEGDWVLVDRSYGYYGFGQAAKVTEKTVSFADGTKVDCYARRVSIDNVVMRSPDREAIVKAREQLKSAYAEKQRREAAARDWYSKRLTEIVGAIASPSPNALPQPLEDVG